MIRFSIFSTLFLSQKQRQYGFMRKFNIDEKKMINWLSMIEAGYHPNPYHNSMHAADVLQVSHYILLKGRMIEKVCRFFQMPNTLFFTVQSHR